MRQEHSLILSFYAIGIFKPTKPYCGKVVVSYVRSLWIPCLQGVPFESCEISVRPLRSCVFNDSLPPRLPIRECNQFALPLDLVLAFRLQSMCRGVGSEPQSSIGAALIRVLPITTASLTSPDNSRQHFCQALQSHTMSLPLTESHPACQGLGWYSGGPR